MNDLGLYGDRDLVLQVRRDSNTCVRVSKF